MKLAPLIFVFTFSLQHLFAQSCLPGGIVFSTQAEVNAFPTNYPGCINIEGNVRIDGDNINDLSPLSQLTSIDGFLRIEDNPALPGLNGLQNITSIGGYLAIYNNQNGAFTDLSGLSSLTSVGGWLNVDNIGSLTSLTGLENLTSVGVHQLYIFNNASLTDISALNHPISIAGNLIISLNSQLSDCAVESICDYLGSFMAPQTVTISNNASGCNSQSEVETACSPLPVSWLYFAVKAVSGYHQLEWATSSEYDNMRFEIQRSSSRTERWKTIGMVSGANQPNSYTFTDRFPDLGTNYYRLKQINYDGSYSFSQIESLSGNDLEFDLVPNPTRGKVSFKNLSIKDIEVSVFNSVGEKIGVYHVSETSDIDLSNEPNGMYFFYIRTDNRIGLKTLIKND